MRHNKAINHLGRKSGHRKAMMANMATSLIMHKRITTTVAKAKALKTYVEPLITKSKEDTTHSRRIVFSYLKNKEAIKELFGVIELVDFNEAALTTKKEEKKSTRRSRAKKVEAPKVEEAQAEAPAQEEAPKAE